MAERPDEQRPGGRMTWPPGDSFQDVIARARELDRVALSMLYTRFLPVVYRFILARVGDPHTAEDVTSETFFGVLGGIAKTRAQDELSFAAWVLGIARNQVTMHFRRQRVRMAAAQALPVEERSTAGEEGDPLEIITARESWSEVVAALDTLTEDQRAVVLYRCVLGYSAEDVGELLGKQPGAVRALQFRALASLARVLGTHPGATLSHLPESGDLRTQPRLRRRGYGP